MPTIDYATANNIANLMGALDSAESAAVRLRACVNDGDAVARADADGVLAKIRSALESAERLQRIITDRASPATE